MKVSRLTVLTLARAHILLFGMVLTACSGGSNNNPAPVDNDDNEGDDPTATYRIGGTIAGLEGNVTLSLNFNEETFSNSEFTFSTRVIEGESYIVLFVSSSTGQDCTVTNGVGTATDNVTGVQITCGEPVSTLQYVDAEVTGNLSSGDYNGDGDADVVFSIRTLDGHTSGSNQEMLRVAYGNGAGSFTNTVDVFRLGAADTGKRGHILTSGDYDASGTDDFAFSGDVLQLFAGNSGTSPDTLYTGSVYNGAPLHAVDVDGNGFEDFLSIIFGGSQRALFALVRNNGSGSFSEQEFVGNFDDPEWSGLCAGAPLNFVTGDFNGDTLQDILAIVIVCDDSGVVNDSHNALSFFAGNGDGTFEYPLSVDVLPDDIFVGGFYFDETFKDMAVGDFDADSDLDIALTSTTNFLHIMLNDGAGRFSGNGRVSIGQAPVHTCAADFNNDGVIDLATIHQDSKNLIISLGNGDGSFVSMPDAIEIKLDPDVDVFDLEIADLDGDSFTDVIVAENGTNPPDSGRGSVQIFLAPGSSR